MRTRLFIASLVFLGFGSAKATEPSASGSASADAYIDSVKPVFLHRCVACHGALKQEAGLRLDTGDLVRKGGEDGAILTPGDSSGSRLIERLSGTDAGERMPPEGSPLSDEEIARIVAWIDTGAESPQEAPPPDPRQHWAFQSPHRSPLPTINNPVMTVRNPIDAFIVDSYQMSGLTPVVEAEPRTLLRRVFLDLTGVPPSPVEMDEFLNDRDPQAYERAVDRLLDSPLYAQRWARHWMDVWRYSDWDGFKEEVRESQRHVWRWREWIIASLEQDKRYDQMLTEMLAGDELHPGDESVLPATGFLARNYNKFNRNTWLDSTVEHTSKAFFGLTMNCCRCHDHKYDPIEQMEYYRLRAIFEPLGVRADAVAGETNVNADGLTRVFDEKPEAATYLYVRGDEKQALQTQPLTPVLPQVVSKRAFAPEPLKLTPEQYHPTLRAQNRNDLLEATERDVVAKRTELAAVRAETEITEAALMQANARVGIAETAVRAAECQFASLSARLDAEQAAFAIPPAPNAAALATVAAQQERAATVALAQLALAEAEQQLVTISTNTPEADPAALQQKQTSKLKAQEALDSARKAAQESDDKFTPIGATYPSITTGRRLAFAKAAVSPENPLTARVAINHMWLRHFGAALVPTVFDFGNNGKPATHPQLLDWLAVELMENGWHMKPIHRLMVTSTVYRLQSGGDSVEKNLIADRDNRLLWRANVRRMEAESLRDSVLRVSGLLDVTGGGPDLDPTLSTNVPRRSIYFRHSKEKRVQLVDLFDGASVTECYRRNETVIPQQALAMMNSRLLSDASGALVSSLGDKTDSVFVSDAFLRVLARSATLEEQQLAIEFLTAQTQRLSGDQLAARRSFVRVLFNHNDFVTIR